MAVPSGHDTRDFEFATIKFNLPMIQVVFSRMQKRYWWQPISPMATGAADNSANFEIAVARQASRPQPPKTKRLHPTPGCEARGSASARSMGTSCRDWRFSRNQRYGVSRFRLLLEPGYRTARNLPRSASAGKAAVLPLLPPVARRLQTDTPTRPAATVTMRANHELELNLPDGARRETNTLCRNGPASPAGITSASTSMPFAKSSNGNVRAARTRRTVYWMGREGRPAVRLESRQGRRHAIGRGFIRAAGQSTPSACISCTRGSGTRRCST